MTKALRKGSTPERREINQHLYRMHHGAKGEGDTFDRLVMHELMHAEGNEEGYAGHPLHRHEGGSHLGIGEVVLHEGEGT